MADKDLKDRVDRELIELLNETRVALPGVQVLLAFLLGVPFTQRFEELSANDRRFFFAAVVAAGLAAMLLMTPTAVHRLCFRRGDKELMVKINGWLVLIGTCIAAVTVSGVVYLIGKVVFGSGIGAWFSSMLIAVAVLLWGLLAVVVRRSADGLEDPQWRPEDDSQESEARPEQVVDVDAHERSHSNGGARR